MYLIGREAKRRALRDKIDREITDSSEDNASGVDDDDNDSDSANDDSDDDIDTEMQCVRGVIKIMEQAIAGG